MERCGWVSQDQLYIDYHDREWGVPETEGRKLFEMICLEGQQAGLSCNSFALMVRTAISIYVPGKINYLCRLSLRNNS